MAGAGTVSGALVALTPLWWLTVKLSGEPPLLSDVATAPTPHR